MGTMAGYKAYNQQEREKAAKLGPESEKAYLRNQFFWTDTYLIMAEEAFDRIFLEIYEEEFID